jgi:hypothetical protein
MVAVPEAHMQDHQIPAARVAHLATSAAGEMDAEYDILASLHYVVEKWPLVRHNTVPKGG